MILLMQVWQDQDGALVVEIGGQKYRHLYEITDGQAGRLALETIERLGAFAQGQTPPPVSVPPEEIPVPSPPEPDEIDQASQALLEEFRRVPQDPRPGTRISLDPVPGRRSDPVRERLESELKLNLAQEIDRLLQVRLQALPAYQNRYIRVVESKDGGLRFQVDDKSYETVDEVADAEARQLIKEAIKQWEAGR